MSVKERVPNLSPKDEYINSVNTHESHWLSELRGITSAHPCGGMMITPQQGAFLSFLIKMLKPERILEIGVFTGYSSLVIAESMSSNAKITAIDKNPEWTKFARSYWEMAGVIDKIDLRLGEAYPLLSELLAQKGEKSFDFIFLDADKKNYPLYYDVCLSLLSDDGLLLIDNTLLGGRVCDPESKGKNESAVRELNEMIYKDERVDSSLLDFCDGMTLVRKK